MAEHASFHLSTKIASIGGARWISRTGKFSESNSYLEEKEIDAEKRPFRLRLVALLQCFALEYRDWLEDNALFPKNQHEKMVLYPR